MVQKTNQQLKHVWRNRHMLLIPWIKQEQKRKERWSRFPNPTSPQSAYSAGARRPFSVVDHSLYTPSQAEPVRLADMDEPPQRSGPVDSQPGVTCKTASPAIQINFPNIIDNEDKLAELFGEYDSEAEVMASDAGNSVLPASQTHFSHTCDEQAQEPDAGNSVLPAPQTLFFHTCDEEAQEPDAGSIALPAPQTHFFIRMKNRLTQPSLGMSQDALKHSHKEKAGDCLKNETQEHQKSQKQQQK